MEDTQNDPFAVLGIAPDADDEAVRAAWLRAVRAFPPERDAEAFERVRNAWDELRDPRRRAERLLHADPRASLAALADALPRARRFAGPGPWLAVLKGSTSGGGTP